MYLRPCGASASRPPCGTRGVRAQALPNFAKSKDVLSVAEVIVALGRLLVHESGTPDAKERAAAATLLGAAGGLRRIKGAPVESVLEKSEVIAVMTAEPEKWALGGRSRQDVASPRSGTARRAVVPPRP